MTRISAAWHNDTALCMKKRLFLLFMFNISDWICTLALLSTGLFKEANPLMRGIIENRAAGFFIKVILPFSLILYAVSKIKDADRKQLMLSNNIALFGVAVYFLLNVYHLVCFAMAFTIIN